MEYTFWMKSINAKEDIERLYPINKEYTDSKGRLIYVHAVGKMKEQELAQIEHYMSIVHGLVLQLSELANTVEQIIVIVDLKGIKLKSLSNKLIIPAIKKVIALSLQYFPEMLFKAFIVNAPMFFQQTWSELEKLMPKPTLDKIRILGSPSDAEINLLVLMNDLRLLQ
jgi:hypothetical protein